MAQKATKPSSNSVALVALPDEAPSRTVARYVLDPTARAGNTLARINKDTPDHDINAFVAELQDQARTASAGNLVRPEAMLTAHAHTLDAIFHELISRSRANAVAGFLQAAETYMRLALKAQSQCHTTVEALVDVKNPPNVAFVRAGQANIAQGPLQVNNGVQPSGAREIEIPRSKLLGDGDGQRLDTGAALAPGRANQGLEAVGAINRAPVAGR